MILLSVLLLVGCSQDEGQSQVLPTLVRFPTLTPTLLPSISPTVTQTATLTLTPSPSVTITNTVEMQATDSALPIPELAQELEPAITATPLPAQFIFGQSAGGRDLVAYRYGTGQFVIMLVGGIHAGFESNTIELVSQLQSHFANNPAMIELEITFIIIPSLNPDGAVRGRILEGRFNGNQVDLNRNWACGWSEDAQFGQGRVDPGDEAFSEPETTALGSLIERVRPAAVFFYHAAADGVFAGNCGTSTADSEGLAEIYGVASGYPSGGDFDAYPVTGTAPGWVHSIGIPALDVELASAEQAEFERNLRALMAVQQWVMKP